MIYLMALALFVWLLGYANERSGLQQNNHKYYLIFAGIMVALVMGLRTRYTGSSDTRTYIVVFNSIRNYENFSDYFDRHLSDTEFIFSETGFFYFVWLLTRVFSDGQVLVLITSIFITWSACRFIYKNSYDVPTSLLVYVCLGLFTFNMSGMRQAMAMSVCLLSYELVKKRKLIPFVLTVLLAMQFHKTAICFFPVYLLPLLKEGKGNMFLYLCAMGIFLVSMDWIIETFNAFTGEDYLIEAEASGGGITVILIYAASLVLPLFLYESLQRRELRTWFLIVIAGFVTYIARYFSNQIMERISYYYFYFTILLLPGTIHELEEQERKLVKMLFGFFAILLFWYRVRGGSFANFKLFFME